MTVRVVVVGDVFVPGDLLATAIRVRCGDQVEVTAVHDWSVAGGRKALHATQHQMELLGPGVVQLDPQIVADAQLADLLVVHFAPVSAELVGGAANLRAVFAARAGTENIDGQATAARNIAVIGIAGRNAVAVAEMTLALALAEMRNIARADRSISQGDWRKEFTSRHRELTGATVGMVGYGAVGRCFSKLLAGFDATMVAYDPYLDPALLRADGVQPATLEEVFASADLVTIFARLTDETERMVDKSLLESMKPGSYFINTARSRLVDYGALHTAMEQGRLAGAALDVFDEEPLPASSPWRSMDNVTLTSHYAGDTDESFTRSGDLVAARIAAFLDTPSGSGR